ncbi:septum formation family protein [Cellulomonas dongxiuzhuiae]|uniref:Septum formation family protein n=1 Tax=Cellulomonas dongxiuzhuiae TaxID=2819979 RepID=A0ABX8GHE9_9CELL|nr:septum formation family protein [Cellulomonas dongxiuzhuiae]MBO3094558.1 septum formation family protein [Cellulomonas dongxiuzhuiae]QWC15578.1 septum formation family protein [Cellulomonas dongxiuzhuiae]
MSPRPLRFLTVPLLAATLAATLTGCGILGDTAEPAQRDEPGGEITASAEADVFSLQLGDCFDYAALSEATSISSVSTIPCGDPHDAEIYAETTLTEEQFRSDLALTEAADATTPTVAEQFCYDAFAGFVGKAYEESTLDYTLFSPSEEGWAQGDDVVQCILLHPDADITGSMRDSAL